MGSPSVRPQAHLCNNGVTVGDVFLFFGLFAEEEGRDRHHRIFGYLEVQSVNAVGAGPDASDQPSGGGRSDGMGMQYLTLLLADKNSLPIPRNAPDAAGLRHTSAPAAPRDRAGFDCQTLIWPSPHSKAGAFI